MMTTLSNLFGYGQLSVRKAHHNAYEKMHPINNPVALVDQQTLLGIEIEVENITQYMDFNHYWSQKEDHSLRNNGREFVSIPLRAYQVEHALNHLEKVFTSCGVTPVFSSRCSVHVHLNVRDFTVEQLQVFFLLYRVFEKHFFHIAGTKRESNIFCVPLYKTHPAQLKVENLFTNMAYWHKYYALNIGTVSGTGDVAKYGTVEFRHLYGTLDRTILMNWINSILCLHKASKSYTLDQLLDKIETLNTTSEYYTMYSTIFGEYTLKTQMSKYDFESCVSHVKISEFGTHGLQMLVNSRYYKKVYTDKYGNKEKTLIEGQIHLTPKDKVIKLTISDDKKACMTPFGAMLKILNDTNPPPVGNTVVQSGKYHHYKLYKSIDNKDMYINIPNTDVELFYNNPIVQCKLLQFHQDKHNNLLNQWTLDPAIMPYNQDMVVIDELTGA